MGNELDTQTHGIPFDRRRFLKAASASVGSLAVAACGGGGPDVGTSDGMATRASTASGAGSVAPAPGTSSSAAPTQPAGTGFTVFAGSSQTQSGGPYATLQNAINAAQPGDTIIGAPGMYVPELIAGYDFTTRITKDLTIRSAVAGQKVVLDATTVSHPGGGAIVYVEDGRSLTLEDFELRGNKHADNYNAGVGGAVNTGTVTLRRCKVTECSNGVFTSNVDTTCMMTLEDCELVNNGTSAGYYHHMYIGNIASLTVRGCWIHNTKTRADYVAEYGAGNEWRECGGHLLKSRARVTTVEASRLTMEVMTGSPTWWGANRCMDISNGGDLTVRGCLLEYRTGQNGGQGQAITWGPEGSINLPGRQFEASRTFSVRIEQNTIVARSDPQTSVTNEDALWICVGNYGWDGSAGGTQPVPPPATYSVVDNIFCGWKDTPPKVLQGGYLAPNGGGHSVTYSTEYAISAAANTFGPLALLTDAASYNYRPLTPVPGSQSWTNYLYVHPSSTGTRTDSDRGAVADAVADAVPAWVPVAGTYGDISSVTPQSANIDPCPSNTCVYSGSHPGYPQSWNSRWSAWCGGVFASGLGSAGSMIFFGGGHGAYDGNDVTRFDVATRTWSEMSVPSLYGEGHGDWPAQPADAPASVVGPFGKYPDGTPFPFHTNMGLCYLPSDAGGGSAGSFVFISHDQTGVVCENDCRLWRFDLATAAANPAASPSAAWSYAPATVSIQNFSFGNGGAQRNALAYDDKRKGVWILRYSGSGQLSFYSFLTGIETQVTKMGDSNWNVTGLDNICLVYHAGKDCLISKDSFMNLCVADLSGLSITSPTAVPCKQFAPATVGGTIPPSFNGAPDQEDLPEYCPYDGNVWLLDWYSKSEIRFYKLVAPANVLSGTWQWSSEALASAGEAVPQIQAISSGRAQGAAFYGRFRYIPAYRAFMWSDDATLRPQIGRPQGFA